MERIRILLADDHPILREGLRAVLETQSDFEVIAEAANGHEAVRLALYKISQLETHTHKSRRILNDLRLLRTLLLRE